MKEVKSIMLAITNFPVDLSKLKFAVECPKSVWTQQGLTDEHRGTLTPGERRRRNCLSVDV